MIQKNILFDLLNRNQISISLANILLFAFAFFISISNTVSSIILIFFTVLLLFQKNTKKNIKKLQNNEVINAIFFFIIFVSISSLWSINNSFFSSINQYIIILFVPILATLNYSEKEKHTSLIFFLFGVFTNIIASLIITKLNHFEFIDKLYFLKNDHYKNIFYLRGFIDHSNLSIFTSFSIFIILEYIFKNKLKTKKIGFIILILILVFFLIYSYGRTGLILFLILGPIYFLIKKPEKTKIIICFLFLLITIIILAPSPLKSRIKLTYNLNKNLSVEEKILNDAKHMSDSLGKNVDYWVEKINKNEEWKNEVINKNTNESITRRFEIWREFNNEINYNLFLGKGLGSIKKLIDDENNSINRMPHNSYLLIFFEFGLIGFLLFLNIFYSQLKLAIQNKKHNLYFLRLIFTITFLICMIINDYIVIFNTVCFFTLFSALLFVEKNKIKQ